MSSVGTKKLSHLIAFVNRIYKVFLCYAEIRVKISSLSRSIWLIRLNKGTVV